MQKLDEARVSYNMMGMSMAPYSPAGCLLAYPSYDEQRTYLPRIEDMKGAIYVGCALAACSIRSGEYCKTLHKFGSDLAECRTESKRLISLGALKTKDDRCVYVGIYDRKDPKRPPYMALFNHGSKLNEYLECAKLGIPCVLIHEPGQIPELKFIPKPSLITPEPVVDSTVLTNLDRKLWINIQLEKLHENWAQQNEKWLRSKAGWLYLLPNGNLYVWNRAARTEPLGGRLIAALNQETYADPRVLAAAASSYSAPFNLKQIDFELGLSTYDARQDNKYGKGEKWVYSAAGWYALSTNGDLYQWDKVVGSLGTKILSLGPEVFQNPSLLADAFDESADYLTKEDIDRLFP